MVLPPDDRRSSLGLGLRQIAGSPRIRRGFGDLPSFSRLNATYASGLIVTLVRGLDLPNCGCYGVFFPQPLRWYSPLEDLVLVGICYALRLSAKKGNMES
jgi:hypothetical protein